eukprot:CAMPEP_0206140192 /NCGR_PEP_ID=MMETSP1473-20131121/8684_1 /ASSEMBLY_ACC=CAM_ASM_001109 /TAXON_ID=1461547 /ORGANISM="Stichococcus sp, Strain RCC1054" /LENGTH=221 /DNA_ID=CAMNT_0053534259 /DNA_START=165 /DNA_END=829 /DNA_ORIENTATION=+
MLASPVCKEGTSFALLQSCGWHACDACSTHLCALGETVRSGVEAILKLEKFFPNRHRPQTGSPFTAANAGGHAFAGAVGDLRLLGSRHQLAQGGFLRASLDDRSEGTDPRSCNAAPFASAGEPQVAAPPTRIAADNTHAATGCCGRALVRAAAHHASAGLPASLFCRQLGAQMDLPDVCPLPPLVSGCLNGGNVRGKGAGPPQLTRINLVTPGSMGLHKPL